jgi:hypothetical protein
LFFYSIASFFLLNEGFFHLSSTLNRFFPAFIPFLPLSFFLFFFSMDNYCLFCFFCSVFLQFLLVFFWIKVLSIYYPLWTLLWFPAFIPCFSWILFNEFHDFFIDVVPLGLDIKCCAFFIFLRAVDDDNSQRPF